MENFNDERAPNALLDRKLLEMIAHAAAGEAAAVEYYNRLSGMLIAADDKKTVHNIALDEAKHLRLFEELYFNLSGLRMPPLEPSEAKPSHNRQPEGSFPAIFEERLHDELGDVEFYRQIYFALANLEYRDILFEAITDELRHAQLMGLLYSKYR